MLDGPSQCPHAKGSGSGHSATSPGVFTVIALQEGVCSSVSLSSAVLERAAKQVGLCVKMPVWQPSPATPTFSGRDS